MEPELFRADHVSLYDEFDKLTEGSQQAFERMTAHSKQSGFDKTTSIFRTNRYVQWLLSDPVLGIERGKKEQGA